MELKSQKWLKDLAFLVEITEYLNILNKMLRGRKKLVTQFQHMCIQVEADFVGDTAGKW